MLIGEFGNLLLLAASALIAVMIAVSTTGKVRQSINWLLAAVLVSVAVVVVADFVKVRSSAGDEATYNQRLVDEKNELAQSVGAKASGAHEMGEKELKVNEAEQLLAIVTSAIRLADTLGTVNMDDYTLSDDQRVSNAADRKRSAEKLKASYLALKPQLVYFKSVPVGSALEKLEKSALYAKLYYGSTDSDQESVRERVMRTSAVAAKEQLEIALKKLKSAL